MHKAVSNVVDQPDEYQLKAIAVEIARYRYRYKNEIQLQDGMQHVLTLAGYEVKREGVLGPRRLRTDLSVDGLVVEVKVDGTLSAALRQVSAYMQFPEVRGVILASTARWANTDLEGLPEWGGKPFLMIRVERQSL